MMDNDTMRLFFNLNNLFLTTHTIIVYIIGTLDDCILYNSFFLFHRSTLFSS